MDRSDGQWRLKNYDKTYYSIFKKICADMTNVATFVFVKHQYTNQANRKVSFRYIFLDT